jgi:hypothetical protein
MTTTELPQIAFIEDDKHAVGDAGPEDDPAVVILTCANCGAKMDERKCKLICLSATSSAGWHH